MSHPNYAAGFNSSNHCVVSGWATYHEPPWRHWWNRWRCHRGHVLPPKPEPHNGYSPQCYARCERCSAALKWFVYGQHRFGGEDTTPVPDHIVKRIIERAHEIEAVALRAPGKEAT